MRRDQAAVLLDRMLGMWPQSKMGDDAAAYWLALLERSSTELARETFEMAVEELKWFPSIAEWQALSRRTRSNYATTYGLPAPQQHLSDTHKALAKQWLPIIRETIKNAEKPTRVRGVTTVADSIQLPK